MAGTWDIGTRNIHVSREPTGYGTLGPGTRSAQLHNPTQDGTLLYAGLSQTEGKSSRLSPLLCAGLGGDGPIAVIELQSTTFPNFKLIFRSIHLGATTCSRPFLPSIQIEIQFLCLWATN